MLVDYRSCCLQYVSDFHSTKSSNAQLNSLLCLCHPFHTLEEEQCQQLFRAIIYVRFHTGLLRVRKFDVKVRTVPGDVLSTSAMV
jgi:hypothetical protein